MQLPSLKLSETSWESSLERLLWDLPWDVLQHSYPLVATVQKYRMLIAIVQMWFYHNLAFVVIRVNIDDKLDVKFNDIILNENVGIFFEGKKISFNMHVRT